LALFGRFGRLGRRFQSRLDAMIRSIENHEALVESAVRDLEAALARTEREHERTLASNERLHSQIAGERDAATSWRERAIREPVEARGVECLRRSKRAACRVDELAARLASHEALEQRLAVRSTEFRRRLADFHEQRALLLARQAEAEESRELGPSSAKPATELVELFQHWEAQLREIEVPSDALSLGFDVDDEEPHSAAEEAWLVLELRALKERRDEH
jgi:phage shock protein A